MSQEPVLLLKLLDPQLRSTSLPWLLKSPWLPFPGPRCGGGTHAFIHWLLWFQPPLPPPEMPLAARKNRPPPLCLPICQQRPPLAKGKGKPAGMGDWGWCLQTSALCSTRESMGTLWTVHKEVAGNLEKD